MATVQDAVSDVNGGGSPPPLKNQDRIDEIRSRMSARHHITLRTSYCSRHLRRDFNIASAKMYVHGLSCDYRASIHEALSDLHWQITMLAADDTLLTLATLDVTWLNACTYDFMLVSPESASMLRALRRIDGLVACLYTGERAGLISREQRRRLVAPISLAYFGFKQVAMKLPGKSIDELLSEANLA